MGNAYRGLSAQTSRIGYADRPRLVPRVAATSKQAMPKLDSGIAATELVMKAQSSEAKLCVAV